MPFLIIYKFIKYNYMNKYTVIIMENGNQVISKKDYPDDNSGTQFSNIIAQEFPDYKTTLEYLEFDKLINYLSHNWGINDKQLESLKNWRDSEEMAISFSELIKS